MSWVQLAGVCRETDWGNKGCPLLSVLWSHAKGFSSPLQQPLGLEADSLLHGDGVVIAHSAQAAHGPTDVVATGQGARHRQLLRGARGPHRRQRNPWVIFIILLYLR